MYRWHERSCRQPNVVLVDSVPYCKECFELASLEERPPLQGILSIPLEDPETFLNWPQAVKYTGVPAQVDDVAEPCRKVTKLHSNPPKKALQLPELLFDDEIRLAQLFPCKDNNSPIHINLQTTRLRHSPIAKYDALSYTLSDNSSEPSSPKPIFISSFWDIAFIPSYLEKALRGIRQDDCIRFIWVDYLSIHHDNIVEKNHQVGLMREIYMNATTVLAYIGETSALSNPAFQSLAKMRSDQKVQLVDKESRDSWSSFLKLPYFSRTWVCQELLLARNVEFFVDHITAPWPEILSAQRLPASTHHPLAKRDPQGHLADRKLLDVLLDTSAYACSDPRDKVFGILGLIRDNISPDYALSVEAVYTGTAAYLITFHHEMNVLAVANSGKTSLNLPSWVPDWSQKQALRFPGDFKEFAQIADDPRSVTYNAHLFAFHGIGNSHPKLLVNAHTGALECSGMKLFDIQGKRSWANHYSHITMSMKYRGTMIITLHDIDGVYRPNKDAVFLVDGWDYPLILRVQPDQSSYFLVGVCALSYTSPGEGEWLVPWKMDRFLSYIPDVLPISRLSADEEHLIYDFSTRVFEIFSQDALMRNITRNSSLLHTLNSFLHFTMLLLTPLKHIEATLKKSWERLNQELGWMFLDQEAVSLFIQYLNNQSADVHSGESEPNIDRGEAKRFRKYSRLEFPSTYEWDLDLFCQSFLQQSVHPHNTADNPVFRGLRTQLPKVREWAQVTEQLLQLFRYTRDFFGPTWDFFPGHTLPGKWLSLSDGSRWEWTEFKNALTVREQIWMQEIPDDIDPRKNDSIAMHLGVRILGLKFEEVQLVIQ